jgi:hypothetical protein
VGEYRYFLWVCIYSKNALNIVGEKLKKDNLLKPSDNNGAYVPLLEAVDTSTPPVADQTSIPNVAPVDPQYDSLHDEIVAQYGTRRDQKRSHNIKVIDYNLEEIYNQNEQARLSGALQEQNAPVRAIAPGRHHISQLLNSVTSQRESFEEHFAQGRRNKREAAQQYGF